MSAMESIGKQLEEARSRRGVSLGEAAESTKVLKEYLQAFEKGDFKLDVPEVYKRGFLLLYVRYLKLDEESIMAEYDGYFSGSSPNERREGQSLFLGDESTSKPSKTLAGEENKSPLLSAGKTNNSLVLGALIVLGVLVLVGSLVFILRPDETEIDLTEALTRQEDSSVGTPVLEPLLPELAIGLTALEDCEDVLVQQLGDGLLLFRGPLKKGQYLVLERKGNVVVKSKLIGLISVKIGDQTFTNSASGPGAWYFNLEKPYNP